MIILDGDEIEVPEELVLPELTLAPNERAMARRVVESTRTREAARQARTTAWLAVLAVLSGFLVAMVTREDAFAADSFGRLASGQLEVLLSSQWTPVSPGEDVLYDRDLRVVGDQDAVIDVRQGTVTLDEGTRARTLPGTVDLQLGSVLFEVQAFWLGLSPLLIARGDGAWRMDADDNPRVSVYRGTASATGALSTGQLRPEARTLRDFEEVRVAAGAVTGQTWLSYSLTDPWDARLAADLLAIDDVVAATGKGITGTYGTDPRPASFYEAFTVVDGGIELALERFDTANAAPVDGEAVFGQPADVLIAVLVTRLLAERASMPFSEAIDEVDELRAAGATWGVVLVRRDLTAADFTRVLDLSLRQVIELGDQAPPAAPPSAQPTPQPSPSPSPSSTPTPLPTVTPPPTPTPTPTPTPSPSPNPTRVPDECAQPSSNPDQCVSAVVDNLIDLIDEIIPPAPGVLDRLFGGGRRALDLLSLAMFR